MVLFDTFNETIFLKNTSELEKKYNALDELNKEYPNNKLLLEEYYMVKKGLKGENEIKYQLEKSNLGLYVLRDLNIEYENLKAQIDYVVITKMYCYFIECKNLIGNIIVNINGDFIREYRYRGKRYKKGIYSPLRQVEAQRDVYKKIWNISLSSNKVINYVKRAISEKNFPNIHRVLVVVANHESILDVKKAPENIKTKVVKVDNLVKRIEQDLNESDKNLWDSKNEMEQWAKAFLSINVDKHIDYYNYYKEKFILNNIISDEELEKRLIEFRKQRSLEMKIPAYYVFNNEELKRLVAKRPKSIAELKSSNLILPIKVKTHGEEIIEIINKK